MLFACNGECPKNRFIETPEGEPGHGGVGAVLGGAAGGLLALIGGPVGILAWVVGGAVIGGVAGKYLGRVIKKGDLGRDV